MGLKFMLIANFSRPAQWKKIRSITVIVWVLGRVEKNAQKKSNKCKKYFFGFKQISKCDTCFYIHFQGLFKNIAFRSVTSVIKTLWAILDFFLHRPDFLLPCTQACPKHKKFFAKNPSNFYSLKVKNFTVIMSKMRVLRNTN